MYTTCIVCGTQELQLLIWVGAKGQPSDRVYHSDTVGVCAACGHGQLEKYDYDGWPTEEEPLTVGWCAITPADVKRLRSLVASCPEPQDPKCGCPIHGGMRPSVATIFAWTSDKKYHWVKLDVAAGVPQLLPDDTKQPQDIAPRKPIARSTPPSNGRTLQVKDISRDDMATVLIKLADRGARKGFNMSMDALGEVTGDKSIDTALTLAKIGCEDAGEVALVGIFEKVLMAAENARERALAAHEGQEYGPGRPYSVHLEAVAEILKPFGDTAVAIAYLHDVVEDTDVTGDQVRDEFGPFVADCVALITDEPGVNRKERKARTYKKLSEISGDMEIALTVKAADRLANVRACIEDGNELLLEVYRSEHEAFRRAAFRAGSCDELWQELNSLLDLGNAEV